MAKKSMIARDVKRKKMVERFAAKRSALMQAFESAADPMERLDIHRKIQQLPRNSAPSRTYLSLTRVALTAATTAMTML